MLRKTAGPRAVAGDDVDNNTNEDGPRRMLRVSPSSPDQSSCGPAPRAAFNIGSKRARVVMDDRHAGQENPTRLSVKPPAHLDVAVRRKALIETIDAVQSHTAISGIAPVDIRGAKAVTLEAPVSVPGTKNLAVVHLIAKLRVDVSRIQSSHPASESEVQRIANQALAKADQPCRIRHNVVVQEGDDGPAGIRNTDVASSRYPPPFSDVNGPVWRTLWYPFVRFTAIEHQEKFRPAVVVVLNLLLETGTKIPALVAAVPGHDDDAERHVGGMTGA